MYFLRSMSLLTVILIFSCTVQNNYNRDRAYNSRVERNSEKITGICSYYGEKFHGKKTANGEVFNMYEFTAAHKSLPFGTKLEVKNIANGKKVIVRINDRGPFVSNRILDLSFAAAEEIDMIKSGTAEIEAEIIFKPNG